MAKPFRRLILSLMIITFILLLGGCFGHHGPRGEMPPCKMRMKHHHAANHCAKFHQGQQHKCAKEKMADCSKCAKHKMNKHHPLGPKDAAASPDIRPDRLYICNCGPDCQCGSVSKTPGNCQCGQPLQAVHLLKVEGDQAIVCSCGPNCQCQLDPDNPELCGCGKAVKRVSLKGSGLFFCNCGGSCTCNTVADKPGDCRCGMPLKQSN